MATRNTGADDWDKSRKDIAKVHPYFGIFHTVGSGGEKAVTSVLGGSDEAKMVGKIFFDPIGFLAMAMGGGKKTDWAAKSKDSSDRFKTFGAQQQQGYQSQIMMEEMSRKQEAETERKNTRMIIFGVVGGVVLIGATIGVILYKRK